VSARKRRIIGALAWAALATGCESVFGIGDLPLPGDGGSGAQDSAVTADTGGQMEAGGQVDQGNPPLDGTMADDGPAVSDGPVAGDTSVASDSPTSTDGPIAMDGPMAMDGAADGPADGPSSSDGPPPVDSAPPPPDAGDSGPTSCYANAPFTPIPWAPPSTFPNHACSSAQIAGYLACFPNCSTFRADPTNTACLACIETDVTATTHGPIITSGGQPVEVNFGGCVAHYDGNTAAGSCGNQENNANDCAGAECGKCADFANPQTGGATDQCETAAFGASGRCSADTVMQTCPGELGDGGVATSCDNLNAFLGLWCGPACSAVALNPPPPAHGGAACPQGDSATCWPHDETAFSPAWVPPVGAHLGRCTTTQVSDFYTACLDTASTPTTCNAWAQNAANTTCFGCLYTDRTATSYGALIGYSQATYLNVAGCVALVEPCNQPCAQTLSDLNACEDGACGSTFCADTTSYNACAMQADSCTSCSGYANSTNCFSLITGAQHPAEAACALNATTFQALYSAVATFMCAP
jgi:hypothetical protein